MMRDDLMIDENQINQELPSRLGFRQRLRNWWTRRTRNQKVALGTAGTLLLVIVLGLTVWIGNDPDGLGKLLKLTNLNPREVEIAELEEPQDHISPLTGERITKSVYQSLVARRPLAVVVENHPDARPQSGLDQADLVFETLAEGGITRFVGVFWSRQPDVVGPVRSLRKYFIDLVTGLDDPLIMHIGGAASTNPEADALGEVQKYGIKSLGVSGGKFWRVGHRFAPHNAYSNTIELWEQAAQNGWIGPASVKSWLYKDPNQPIENVEMGRFQLNWNGWGANTWSVVWEFDPTTNRYKRSHLDEPHIDAVTGEQLTARNVVVVFANQGLANDGTARITFDVVGDGRSLILRDGRVIEGSWSKPTRTDRFKFSDTSGLEIEFNRGNTWVMVVPLNSDAIY